MQGNCQISLSNLALHVWTLWLVVYFLPSPSSTLCTTVTLLICLLSLHSSLPQPPTPSSWFGCTISCLALFFPSLCSFKESKRGLSEVLNIFIKLLLCPPPSPLPLPFLLHTSQLSPQTWPLSASLQRLPPCGFCRLPAALQDHAQWPPLVPAALNPASSATLGWATSDGGTLPMWSPGSASWLRWGAVGRRGSGFRRPAVSWFSDCYQKTSSGVTTFPPHKHTHNNHMHLLMVSLMHVVSLCMCVRVLGMWVPPTLCEQKSTLFGRWLLQICTIKRSDTPLSKGEYTQRRSWLALS